MTPTIFQKLQIDHAPQTTPRTDDPLRYDQLRDSGFEAINFRPEDHADGYQQGVDTVAARIEFARKQPTFRSHFAGNVWVADPASVVSQAAGIPVDAEGWAWFVINFILKLTGKVGRPEILKLNIEFTGKGYPSWQAHTIYRAWSVIQVDGVMWQTQADGQTGDMAPKWAVKPGAAVKDGTVTWHLMVDAHGLPRTSNPNGWLWNERAAELIFDQLSALPIEVQPMSMQADFNLGAWMGRGARCSPQCYGPQPYLAVTDPAKEIDAVAGNPYMKNYYGSVPDRRRVHPTIGAFGQGKFYVPLLRKARERNIFGLRMFPHNNLAPSDYRDYRQFAIT